MIASVTSAISNLIPNGADRAFMTLGGILGAALSVAFGDMAPLVWWLLALAIVDTFTGIMAAWRTNTYTTKKFSLGIFKKIFMFVMVALAHGLDIIFEPVLGIYVMQPITLCAYALAEVSSIVENMIKAGLEDCVPPTLRKLIHAVSAHLEQTVDKLDPENKK